VGWLSGWRRRKKGTIRGTTAGAQTNYQMKITVHKGTGTDSPTDVYCGGNCRDDFGDIRFTDSDGTTLLSYWIEKVVPGDYAVFWVKILSIPASPDSVDVYMYYGNPSATSVSDGDATFDFFDDFEPVEGWVEKAQTTVNRGDGNKHGIIYDNKIYLIGGLTSLSSPYSLKDSLSCYDPSTNSFTSLAPLLEPKASVGACVYNGAIYIIGGINGDAATFTDDLDKYDISTNTWTHISDDPAGAHEGSALVGYNGKLYRYGGCFGGSGTTSIEEYDLSTGTWTTKTPCPVGRAHMAYGLINGKLYIAGGADGGTIHGDTYEYDIANDKWTKKTDMPTPRYHVASFVYNNKLYVIGGRGDGGTVYKSVVEIYDPSTDTWDTTSIPNLPQNIAFAFSGYDSEGNIYVFDGFTDSHALIHKTYKYYELVGALDPNKWNPPTADGVASVSGGILTLTRPSTGSGNTYLISKYLTSFGQIVEYRWKPKQLGDSSHLLAVGQYDSSTKYYQRQTIDSYTATNFSYDYSDGTTQTSQDSGKPKDTEWHRFTTKLISASSVKYYIDNAYEWEQTSYIALGYPGVRCYGGAGIEANVLVDWVLVRKYADPEPIWGTWGSEELAPVAAGKPPMTLMGV